MRNWRDLLITAALVLLDFVLWLIGVFATVWASKIVWPRTDTKHFMTAFIIETAIAILVLVWIVFYRKQRH